MEPKLINHKVPPNYDLAHMIFCLIYVQAVFSGAKITHMQHITVREINRGGGGQRAKQNFNSCQFLSRICLIGEGSLINARESRKKSSQKKGGGKGLATKKRRLF